MTIINVISLIRQLRLNSVNNMAWRVKPEEVLIEVGKFGNYEVGFYIRWFLTRLLSVSLHAELLANSIWCQLGSGEYNQLRKCRAVSSGHHNRNLQGREVKVSLTSDSKIGQRPIRLLLSLRKDFCFKDFLSYFN